MKSCISIEKVEGCKIRKLTQEFQVLLKKFTQVSNEEEKKQFASPITEFSKCGIDKNIDSRQNEGREI